MPLGPSRLIVGWQEWVSLPELGLLALKAKFDTGAKTSALHTSFIEAFGSPAHRKVRFWVQPWRNAADLKVAAVADVIDQREIVSSNGVREMRYVISTLLCIAGRQWPIEVTLTDRSCMSSRMLIGRQGIPPDVLVDCASKFRQPRLNYRLYGQRQL